VAAGAKNEVSNSQPTPTPNNSSTASSPNEDAAAEAALLESINRSREQAGVPPVRLEESLRQAALLHAQRIVASQRLEHQFSGEPSLLQRIANASPLPLDRAGENLANASCPDGAHEVLMRSAPHRKNLLDPRFNVAGIAALWSRGRLYVVQDFAHTVPTLTVRQTARLVQQSIDETRHEAALPDLTQVAVPHLDEAACTLARQNHPSARLIAASYTNRKIVTYTQSRPDVLSPGALRLLNNPNLRQFAVGSCYARNTAYPTGIYWVAILLN
jgi:uncharacterized protein YkwD